MAIVYLFLSSGNHRSFKGSRRESFDVLTMLSLKVPFSFLISLVIVGLIFLKDEDVRTRNTYGELLLNSLFPLITPVGLYWRKLVAPIRDSGVPGFEPCSQSLTI